MTTAKWDLSTEAQSAKVDVVGVGENSVDVIIGPDGSRQVLPGGQIATALCACSALGLRTTYVGTFGDDENGRRIRDVLERRGVDTTHAITRQARNRHAVILVDRGGERTVFWQRPSALRLSPGDIDPDVIAGARLLHVDSVDEEAALRAARLARESGLHVTTDIDRVTQATSALLQIASVPILAEHVPHTLTGEANPEQALRALRQRHSGTLCVTLGARGAMLLDGERLHYAQGFALNAVDTTGAGDVFRGAFIHALLRGDSPEVILRFANAAAAISCTREGAIGGVPTLMEIETLLHTTQS
jgi:sugar/nucleoside kinase (ribokinase family)